MKEINLTVHVVEFNADLFAENYNRYIVSRDLDPFGSSIFKLCCPEHVAAQINNLNEEGVNIW